MYIYIWSSKDNYFLWGAWQVRQDEIERRKVCQVVLGIPTGFWIRVISDSLYFYFSPRNASRRHCRILQVFLGLQHPNPPQNVMQIHNIHQYTSKVGAPYFSKQFLLSLAPQVTLVGSKVKLLLTRFRNLNVISQCHEVCLSAPACLGLSPSSLALQACPEAEGKSFSDGKTWDGTVFFLRIHEDQFPTSNGWKKHLVKVKTNFSLEQIY